MRNAMLMTALALLLTIGCNQQPASTASTSNSNANNTTTAATASSNLSPEQLGELGAQIKKSPSDADKLLSQRGMDEKSFATAVRKVSENPNDAKRYADAFKRAS